MLRAADSKPRLALTIGDCAGIGPELALRALADPDVASLCRLVVYGSQTLLQRVARRTGLPFSPHETTLEALPAGSTASRTLVCGEHILLDFPFAEANAVEPGRTQSICGREAHHWITAAVKDIGAGFADGLVTAPIDKAAMQAAGVGFSGHTELLAHLTGGSLTPCMAFHAERLFVALATIHEPLSKVPGLLSVPALLRTIKLVDSACRGFAGGRQPRIGVLALNPHAGEQGLFGDEEHRIIAPAIELARAAGLQAYGPLVPDSAFTWVVPGRTAPYDAYVAMYHDQGLIPFKMVAFDTGVNLTLGLPLIRTSPDHGTAYDLAWQGLASPASLQSAIMLAARMVRTRRESAPRQG